MSLLSRLSCLAALALVVACGPSLNQTKCQAACAPPSSGSCSSQSSTACVDQCVAATAGLATTCVQCIAEHTGWDTIAGNGGGPDGGGGTPASCSFSVGKATSSSCTAFCGPDAG